MAQHRFFYQSAFAGSSGTGLATYVPDYSEGLSSPYYSIASGTFTANGSGAMVGGTNSTGFINLVLPASGQFDYAMSYTLSGSQHVSFSIRTTSSHAISVELLAGTGTINVIDALSSNNVIGTITGLTLTGSHVYTAQFRMSGGVAHINILQDGTAIGATYTSTQSSIGGLNLSFVDYASGAQLTQISVYDALPTTGVPSGPSTSTTYSQSTAYTITLGDAAPVGGQVVNLASSVGGDTFQATLGGGNVTSTTIAEGSLTGTFYCTASTNAARTLTPTSSGVTFSPTTLTLTSSGGATAITLSGPTTGNVGVSTGNFSVTPNGPYTGTVSIALSGAAAAGLTTPVVLTFNNSSAAQTFAETPTVAGSLILTETNSGSLTNTGSPITDVIAGTSATAFTLSGPSSGFTGVPSTNFTFQPNGLYTGTITPSMTGLAGTWSPTSLTWSGDASAKTATFQPSATGSGNANGTASPSLTAPSNVAYTANPQLLTLTTNVSSIGTGGTVVATVTPTPAATGGWTVTPTGSAAVGLSPIGGTFANSTVAQTASFIPTVPGSLILTLTTTTGQTVTGSPITVTVSSLINYLCSIVGLPPGLAIGTSANQVSYQVATNGGTFGSAQTAGATERVAGTGWYAVMLQFAPGTIVEVAFTDNSGHTGPATVEIASVFAAGGNITNVANPVTLGAGSIDLPTFTSPALEVLTRRLAATGVTSPLTADTYEISYDASKNICYKSDTLVTPMFFWFNGSGWTLSTALLTNGAAYFTTAPGASVLGPYTAQGSATGLPVVTMRGGQMLDAVQLALSPATIAQVNTSLAGGTTVLAANQAVNATQWGGVNVTGMPLPTASYTAPPAASAIVTAFWTDLLSSSDFNTTGSAGAAFKGSLGSTGAILAPTQASNNTGQTTKIPATVAAGDSVDAAAIKVVTDKLATALQSDGGSGFQFTATAMAQANPVTVATGASTTGGVTTFTLAANDPAFGLSPAMATSRVWITGAATGFAPAAGVIGQIAPITSNSGNVVTVTFGVTPPASFVYEILPPGGSTSLGTNAPAGWLNAAAFASGAISTQSVAAVASLSNVNLSTGTVSASPPPTSTSFTATGNLNATPGGYATAPMSILWQTGANAGFKYPIATHSPSGSNHGFTTGSTTPFANVPAAGDTFVIG